MADNRVSVDADVKQAITSGRQALDANPFDARLLTLVQRWDKVAVWSVVCIICYTCTAFATKSRYSSQHQNVNLFLLFLSYFKKSLP
jgi:hypothetical protein